MTGQPRVPAGQAGGGQFAAVECPATYRRIVEVLRPPGPVLRQVPESSVPLSTVAICCPGCVYESAEYLAAVAYWQEHDAR